jgi:tripartite-type tricarboxylate transporter receptor subunit TctC
MTALTTFAGRALIACALFSVAATAPAQDYPNRTVRLVVPFPAGGGADLNARSLADRLGKLWGQTVVVDNISGAGGAVAAGAVARAKPDGYTVFFATHPIISIYPFLHEKLSYDADNDFLPVVKVVDSQFVLLVNAQSAIGTIADLIRIAKEKPGAINFGSGGVGTTQHLTAELFKASANIEISHVPYRGTAPAAAALMANEIQMHFDSTFSAMNQIRAGRLRGIAVTSANRLPQLPDIPTLNEAGLQKFESSLAYVLLMPAGTPTAVVSTMNRDANKVLSEPAYRKQIQDQGITVQGGTPEQLRAFLLAERKKWGELLKRLNLKPQ